MTSRIALNPGQVWRQWTLAVTVGEFLGFAVPTLICSLILSTSQELSEVAKIVLISMAGMVEGGILAVAQWLILRRYLPNFKWQNWIILTAIAAGFAWIVGIGLAGVVKIAAVKSNLLVFATIPLIILLLISIGGAQWFILRRYFSQAKFWILANALAWSIGVAIPVIALSQLPNDIAIVWRIITGVISGLLMGGVVGGITGIFLIWFLRNQKIPVILNPVK